MAGHRLRVKDAERRKLARELRFDPDDLMPFQYAALNKEAARRRAAAEKQEAAIERGVAEGRVRRFKK